MNKLMKKSGSLFFALLLVLLLTGSGMACVGKTLVIGSTGGLQQDLLANMIAQLITERTGTTVKVESFPSSLEAHEAMLRDKIDMYVEYTGVGQTQILKAEPLADADALYQLVKKRYNEELNLIWLDPLGFEGKLHEQGIPAQAAPVARKDTLKKFPALARLINKLGGKIDGTTIAKLEQNASAQGAKQVARDFLKDNRLI